jgi:hypothetical protein
MAGWSLTGHFRVHTMDARADVIMPERAAQLTNQSGVKAEPATLSRLLGRHGFTDQKCPAGGGMRTGRHS